MSADEVEPPERQPTLTDRGEDLRSAALDATALAYLAVALVVTAFFDGGADDVGLLLLGGTALLAAPLVHVEASRAARGAQLLLLAWGLGILLSLVFAAHRADMTRAILAYALPPVALFAALRIRRRPWGAWVLVGILGTSAIVYWGRALSTWVGPPLEHMRSNWLSVSWHNPTGALMGCFALLGLAFGIRLRSRWAVVASAACALSLAGLWVTGSRGAMIATALGVIVTLVASRDLAWPRVTVASVAILVGAVLSVAVLLQLGGIRAPTGGTRPHASAEVGTATTELVRIGDSAGGNLRARFAHMEAGLELFSMYPPTGAGMGAYGDLANRLVSPGANLTLSAHNQFVEALAEGGLLFGVPFLMAGVAVGVSASRRAYSPRPDGGHLVAGFSAGTAGVTVLLLVHSAVDIDWVYPVIPALLATAAAVTWDHRAISPRVSHRLAAAPLTMALIVGVGAAGTEAWTNVERASDRSELSVPAAPWDLHRRIEAARTLASGGEISAARMVLQPAHSWNPRSPRLEMMRAVLAYREGATDAGDLASRLNGVRTGASTYVVVAEALLERGDLDRASSVIEEGFELTTVHPGTPHARAELWELKVRYSIEIHGCSGANALVDTATADEDQLAPYVNDIENRLADVLDEQCPTR